MEATSEWINRESWEGLKDPEGEDYFGLPEEPPKKREYPLMDFDMVIEDTYKGKPHFWPQKGKSAILIGKKIDRKAPLYQDEKETERKGKRELERIYLIKIDETNDSAFIFIYNDKYPMMHARKTDKGIYLNGRKLENIDIIDNESELLVGRRKFKIRHKYSI